MIFKKEKSIIGYLIDESKEIKTEGIMFNCQSGDICLSLVNDISFLTTINRSFISAFKDKINVKYISQAFMNAYYETEEKIYKSFKLNDVLIQLYNKPQIIILPTEKSMSMSAIISTGKDDELGLFIYVSLYIDEKLLSTMIFKKDIICYYSTVTSFKNIKTASKMFLYMLFFIKHIPIESKTIQPKQKIKEIECKYLNTCEIPIEIIDSRWFTDLIVSGKFKVRGHFRLQPYGTGLTDKKIIWITEYTKQGYTLKNRKENKQ